MHCAYTLPSSQERRHKAKGRPDSTPSQRLQASLAPHLSIMAPLPFFVCSSRLTGVGSPFWLPPLPQTRLSLCLASNGIGNIVAARRVFGCDAHSVSTPSSLPFPCPSSRLCLPTNTGLHSLTHTLSPPDTHIGFRRSREHCSHRMALASSEPCLSTPPRARRSQPK